MPVKDHQTDSRARFCVPVSPCQCGILCHFLLLVGGAVCHFGLIRSINPSRWYLRHAKKGVEFDMALNYSTYLKKDCMKGEELCDRPRVGTYNCPEKPRNGEASVKRKRIPGERRQPLALSGGDVRHGMYGTLWPLREAWQGSLAVTKIVILRGIGFSWGGIPLSCGWENLWGGFLS